MNLQRFNQPLLNLANTKLGRKCLGIKDNRKIAKITSNSVHFEQGGNVEAELYNKPVFGNKFRGAVNLGMTGLLLAGVKYFFEPGLIPLFIGYTLSVYPTLGDGRITKAGGNWADVRGASSGSDVRYNNTAEWIRCSYSGGNYTLDRLFFAFNTLSIPAGVTITSATFRFYNSNSIFSNDDNTSLNIVQASQPSLTVLTVNDFNNVAFTNGGSINLSSITAGHNLITLNSTGRGWINDAAHTKLAMIYGRDLNNQAPTGSNDVYTISLADTSGSEISTTLEPLLTVVYPLDTNKGYIF